MRFLLSRGVKAIVIACNTATACAVSATREIAGSVPVVGIEPAVIPAIKYRLSLRDENGSALPTLCILTRSAGGSRRIADLFGRFSKYADGSEGLLLCTPPRLAEAVEESIFDTEKTTEAVREAVGGYRGKISTAVLGCTHYSLIKNEIADVLGGDVRLFDGAEGAARRLFDFLRGRDMLCEESENETENAMKGDGVGVIGGENEKRKENGIKKRSGTLLGADLFLTDGARREYYLKLLWKNCADAVCLP